MNKAALAELTAKHIETLERHDCVDDIGGVYALTTKEQSLCTTLHAWGFLELVRRDDKGPIYRTTDAGRAVMGMARAALGPDMPRPPTGSVAELQSEIERLKDQLYKTQLERDHWKQKAQP